MRVIRCCEDGKIYTGYKQKDDTLSDKGRIEVTTDCIIAVMKHISCSRSFLEDGFAGFTWSFNDGDGSIVLSLIDSSKYAIVDKEQFDIVQKEIPDGE